MGTCSIAGCLIGFPALDVMPHGLGHTVQQKTHAFEEQGVCLPRLELNRRSEYNSALAKYIGTGGDTGNYLEDTGLAHESCARLQEAVRRVDF